MILKHCINKPKLPLTNLRQLQILGTTNASNFSMMNNFKKEISATQLQKTHAYLVTGGQRKFAQGRSDDEDLDTAVEHNTASSEEKIMEPETSKNFKPVKERLEQIEEDGHETMVEDSSEGEEMDAEESAKLEEQWDKEEQFYEEVFENMFKHQSDSYANFLELEDQLGMMRDLQIVLEKANSVNQINVEKAKAQVKKDLQLEKLKYLNFLKNKERKLSQNVDEKIFQNNQQLGSMIERENKAIEEHILSTRDFLTESQGKLQNTKLNEARDEVLNKYTEMYDSTKDDELKDLAHHDKQKLHDRKKTILQASCTDMDELKLRTRQFENLHSAQKRQHYRDLRILEEATVAELEVLHSLWLQRYETEEERTRGQRDRPYQIEQGETLLVPQKELHEEYEPYFDAQNQKLHEKLQQIETTELVYKPVEKISYEVIEKTELQVKEIKEMLDYIKPYYLQHDYMDIKEIQQRIQKLDQIFNEAEKKQLENLDKVAGVQERLSEFKDEISSVKIQEQIYDVVNKYGTDITQSDLEYFANAEHFLSNLKKAVDGLPEKGVSIDDIEAKKDMLRKEQSIIYDQTQACNLLTMLNSMPEDFQNHPNVKEEFVRSEDRLEILEDNQFRDNTAFPVYDKTEDMKEWEQHQSQMKGEQVLIDETHLKQEDYYHLELEQRKPKEFVDFEFDLYNVDVAWVKSKSLEKLQEVMKEYRQSLNIKSELLSEDFVQDQTRKKLVASFAEEEDQEALSRRFKIYASANNIKDDNLIGLFEKKIREKAKKGHNFEFETSDALKKRLRHKGQSIFEAVYQPVNKDDQHPVKELITYNTYKLRQIRQLTEERDDGLLPHQIDQQPMLVLQMTNAKKEAWIQIYNDYTNYMKSKKKEENEMHKRYSLISSQEQFFELFRDWKDYSIGQEFSHLRQERSLKGVYTFDKDGNRVEATSELDQISILRERKAVMQEKIEKFNQQSTAIDTVNPAFEFDYGLMKAQRDAIWEVKDGIAAGRQLKRLGEEGKLEKQEMLDDQEHNLLQYETEQLEKMINQFKEKYDQEPLRENFFEANLPEPMNPEQKRIFLHNEENRLREQGIALIDDNLVRQIESHLAGLPRASMEYGLDIDYIEEKKARETQFFDQENYNMFLDAERLDKMTNYEKQQELLFRRKNYEVQLTSEYEERKRVLKEENSIFEEQEELGIDAIAINLRSKEVEEYVLSHPDQNVDEISQALENLSQQKLQERAKKQYEDSDKPQLLEDLVEKERNLVKEVNDKITMQDEFSKLRNYIYKDKFNLHDDDIHLENERMMAMAARFEPFDIHKIVEDKTNRKITYAEKLQTLKNTDEFDDWRLGGASSSDRDPLPSDSSGSSGSSLSDNDTDIPEELQLIRLIKESKAEAKDLEIEVEAGEFLSEQHRKRTKARLEELEENIKLIEEIVEKQKQEEAKELGNESEDIEGKEPKQNHTIEASCEEKGLEHNQKIEASSKDEGPQHIQKTEASSEEKGQKHNEKIEASAIDHRQSSSGEENSSDEDKEYQDAVNDVLQGKPLIDQADLDYINTKLIGENEPKFTQQEAEEFIQEQIQEEMDSELEYDDEKYGTETEDEDRDLQAHIRYDSIGEQLNQANSALQIIQAAKTQRLSARDQEYANLYQPDNSIRQIYLRAKYQMYVNQQIRAQLAKRMNMCNAILKEIQEKQTEIKTETSKFVVASTVNPAKIFDFSQMDEIIRNPIKKTLYLIQKLRDFNPNSREVGNFNQELMIQLGILQNKEQDPKKKEVVISQIKYILAKMKKNNVFPDIETFSLQFMIAQNLNNIEEQTLALKRVLQCGQFEHQPLSNSSLEKFFGQCLKHDNFDGLAYLASYVETHDVDISKWKMNKFRSALNFYLNHAFNLNKLMTFSRFYLHKARKAIEKETIWPDQEDQTSFEQYDRVFGDLEALVDMSALFEHLVQKVGSRTFVDPVTNEDPMLNIINFFTRPDVQDICRQSIEGTTNIRSKDISTYLLNHSTDPKLFTQVSNAVVGLNQTKKGTNALVKHLVKDLRKFKIDKNHLPDSFTVASTRNLYISLKAGKELLSEETAEFLLFLFKELNMIAETIDLCDNFHTIVEGYSTPQEAVKSDIRTFYMSESILSHPELAQSNNYNDLVDNAVFQNTDKESAAYLSSMVKAFMKDGNVDHALSFFQDKIKHRRSLKQQEEEQMIKLFNASFGSSKDISIDNFKKRYLTMMTVRDQTLKELVTIEKLESLLTNCDPDEIEKVFLMQIMQKEQRQLVQKLCAPSEFAQMISHLDTLNSKEAISSFINNLRNGINKKQLEKVSDELFTINQRKVELKKHIKAKNMEALKTIMERMDDDGKVHMLLGVQSLDAALRQIGMSKQEYDQLTSQENLQQKYKQDFYSTLKGHYQIETTPDLSESNKIMKKFNLYFDRELTNNFKYALEFQEAQNKEVLSPSPHHPFDAFEMNTELRITDYLEDINDKEEVRDDPDELEALTKFRDYIYQDSLEGPFSETDSDDEERDPFMVKLEEEEETMDHIQNTLMEGIVPEELLDGDPFQEMEDAKIDQERKAREKAEKEAQEEDFKMFQDDPYQTLMETDLMRTKTHKYLVEGMQDQLAEAYEERKKHSLSKLVKEFNKIQDIKFKSFDKDLVQTPNTFTKTEIHLINQSNKVQKEIGQIRQKAKSLLKDYNNKNNKKLSFDDFLNENGKIDFDSPLARQLENERVYNGYRINHDKTINQALDEFDQLLSDPRSPVVSNFLYALNYNNGDEMMDIEDYMDMVQKNRDPMDNFVTQSQILENQIAKVEKVHASLNEILARVDVELINTKSKKQASELYYAQWKQTKSEKFQGVINEKVQKLHNDFNSALGKQEELRLEFGNQNSEEGIYHLAMNDQDKVRLMQHALALQDASYRPFEIFNSFYSEDLVSFGIRNNVPEAVRLGELMLQENGTALPVALAKAAKQYKLQHSEKYQGAMKKTGPIDINKVYTKMKHNHGEGYAANTLIDAEDPYWAEFYARNYRAQDRHKLPSGMAWDYKEHGLLGEAVDVKEIQRRAARARELF